MENLNASWPPRAVDTLKRDVMKRNVLGEISDPNFKQKLLHTQNNKAAEDPQLLQKVLIAFNDLSKVRGQYEYQLAEMRAQVETERFRMQGFEERIREHEAEMQRQLHKDRTLMDEQFVKLAEARRRIRKQEQTIESYNALTEAFNMLQRDYNTVCGCGIEELDIAGLELLYDRVQDSLARIRGTIKAKHRQNAERLEDEKAELQQKLQCCVCFNVKQRRTFYRCGHGVCAVCSRNITSCPLCRKPCNEPRTVYLY